MTAPRSLIPRARARRFGVVWCGAASEVCALCPEEGEGRPAQCDVVLGHGMTRFVIRVSDGWVLVVGDEAACGVEPASRGGYVPSPE